MPKEVVRNYSRAIGHDGAVIEDDRFQAEVHWSRDMYVQVATVKLAEDFGESGKVEGWFVELDRSGINRLIRILRKARDQAFGADA